MKHLLSILLAVLLCACCPTASAANAYLLDIQPLWQGDYTETLFDWNGEPKSVESSGCGAVCVAMVEGYLTPDSAKAPDELLLQAYQTDRYHGNGLSKMTLVELLAESGISASIRFMDVKSLRIAFFNKRPVIVLMQAGLFSTSEHYVLLTGIDEHNRLTLIDPNSEENSGKLYTYDEIWHESDGKTPFLVCRPSEEKTSAD